MNEKDDPNTSKQNDEDYEKILKMIVIGDCNVGKSNIFTRYLKNEFDAYSQNTVGVEFGSKSILKNGVKIKLQIWDTAGQERFRSITTAYYRRSNGCFIVYDITNKETFDNVEKWYEETKKFADKDLSVILIGNKNDLEEEREVTIEMGKKKAENLKCPFFETSALTGYQIDMAFQEIVDEIINKLPKEDDSDLGELITDGKNIVNINTEKEVEKKEKSGCC